jgi:hypothetical protein
MSLCERRYIIISDLRRNVFQKARNFLILEKKNNGNPGTVKRERLRTWRYAGDWSHEVTEMPLHWICCRPGITVSYHQILYAVSQIKFSESPSCMDWQRFLLIASANYVTCWLSKCSDAACALWTMYINCALVTYVRPTSSSVFLSLPNNTAALRFKLSRFVYKEGCSADFMLVCTSILFCAASRQARGPTQPPI